MRRKLGHADLAQDTFLPLLSAPEHTPEQQSAWQLREARAYLTVVAKRLMANMSADPVPSRRV